MAQTIDVLLSTDDRAQLTAVIGDRNRPQKHVQRARIILLSADRLPVAEVARQAGSSRPAVWRWQLGFAEEGVAGLLRDKTRKPGRAPLSPATVAKILALPCGKPPKAATHWTGRAVAKAVGVSLRAVQRIWEANRLQPHRIRTFKKSNDPAFAAKVEDIVGLYMNPPAHAVVVSIDEKSQIQALDRTQPGLPLKPGRCGTMTHDYKRHGTTTLFAALNILDGSVVGRCMPRHTHQEFIKFLSAVERAVPAGKIIHAIADNYATHKHPKVRAWLADHPRWVFHTLCPLQGREVADTEEAVRKLGAVVASVRLHNRIAYSRAQQSGLTAMEYEPEGKAAQELRQLYEFVCMHVWPNAKNSKAEKAEAA